MSKQFDLSRWGNFRSVMMSVFFGGAMMVVMASHGLAQQPQQQAVSASAPVQTVSGQGGDQAGSSALPTEHASMSSDASGGNQPASHVAPPSSSNPYGLQALWSGGDIVSRITLLVMGIMSLGSWYVIVMKVIRQSRMGHAAKEVRQKQFWQQPTLRKGVETLDARSVYRDISESGIDAAAHYEEGSLHERIDLYSWVSMALHRALDTVQGNLQQGLAFLGTVGSTAPFVGLFGTVWGIHHALSAISIAGQATLDKVAGPVGESLIMTAIGLATAVPAVLGYNFLVRRNKVIMDQARNFAADVQTVLLGGNLHQKVNSSEQGKQVS